MLREDLEPTHGGITYSVPENTVLKQDADCTLVTTAKTHAWVDADETSVQLRFEPALRFVIHPDTLIPMGWATEDVRWFGASYVYGGKVTARIERVAAWFAFDFASDRVRSTVEAGIAELFEGLAFSRPGYSPFKDPKLKANLEALKERVSGARGPRPPSPVTGLRFSVRLKQPLKVSSDGGGAELPGGATVRVNATCKPTVQPHRLIAIERAGFEFDPPLRVRSGDDQIAIDRFTVASRDGLYKVTLDPHDMKHERRGSGATLTTALLALGGLLVDVATTGAPGTGMVSGGRAASAMTASVLSERLTRAAGMLLEKLKPDLRREAPLIDWDAMFFGRSGEPALPRPLNHH